MERYGGWGSKDARIGNEIGEEKEHFRQGDRLWKAYGIFFFKWYYVEFHRFQNS